MSRIAEMATSAVANREKYVYLETLENSSEQSKEPYET